MVVKLTPIVWHAKNKTLTWSNLTTTTKSKPKTKRDQSAQKSAKVSKKELKEIREMASKQKTSGSDQPVKRGAVAVPRDNGYVHFCLSKVFHIEHSY